MYLRVCDHILKRHVISIKDALVGKTPQESEHPPVELLPFSPRFPFIDLYTLFDLLPWQRPCPLYSELHQGHCQPSVNISQQKHPQFIRESAEGAAPVSEHCDFVRRKRFVAGQGEWSA